MNFDMNIIVGYIIQYGLKISAALIIFVIGKWLAGLVSRIVEKAMLQTKTNKTLITFGKNVCYFGILIFVFIAALQKLGVETTSFVALIGAAGLAVGLALQGSLANFAAGVMVVIFQPFGVGDFIEAAGAAGTVEEIQVFNTVLTTQDNKRIILPNAKITSDKIVIHQKSAES